MRYVYVERHAKGKFLVQKVHSYGGMTWARPGQIFENVPEAFLHRTEIPSTEKEAV